MSQGWKQDLCVDARTVGRVRGAVVQDGGVGAAAADGGVRGVPAAALEVREVQEDRLQLQPFPSWSAMPCKED